MAVGKVPTLDELNQYLAGDAQAVESVMAGVRKRWDYISEVTEAGLTGEPWNMSPEDAAEMFRQFNYLSTVSGVWFGANGQPDPFDFSDATGQVRGGQ